MIHTEGSTNNFQILGSDDDDTDIGHIDKNNLPEPKWIQKGKEFLNSSTSVIASAIAHARSLQQEVHTTNNFKTTCKVNKKQIIFCREHFYLEHSMSHLL